MKRIVSAAARIACILLAIAAPICTGPGGALLAQPDADDAKKTESAKPSESDQASALLKEGKYAEAEKLLDKVLKANDKDEAALYRRAIARSYQDNPKGALEDINRSLDLGPVNVGKCRSRAIIFLQLRQYGEAVQDFEAIAKVYSDDKQQLDRETLMLTAVALICKGGQDGKASGHMFLAAQVPGSNRLNLIPLYATWGITARVATDPKHKDNYGHLMKLLKSQVDAESADVAAEKAKGTEVAERMYRVLTGQFILGEVSEADYLSVAKALPADSDTLCEAYYYIAMRHLASGDKIKAAEFLNKSADLKRFRSMLWMMAEGLRSQKL